MSDVNTSYKNTEGLNAALRGYKKVQINKAQTARAEMALANLVAKLQVNERKWYEIAIGVRKDKRVKTGVSL